MAILFPTREKIEQLTVLPTEGERYLLHYLENNLDNDYLIFYEPFLNGSRPDLIILKEGGGAVIIEIKDWILSHYFLSENNKWYVLNNGEKTIIKSPMAQVFTYKEQLFDMHLPVLGLSDIAHPDKYFFGTIHCFCYFHNAQKENFNSLYNPPLSCIQREINLLNNKRRNNEINHSFYEKEINFYDRNKDNIQRDRRLSFGKYDLGILLSKIRDRLKPNPLFSFEIFDDFYRRLSPPEFILKQNIPKYFDEKQRKVLSSSAGFSKVKGVAGCGKTTLIAHRTKSAYQRLQDEGISDPKILILTYNVTLGNYISDKLTEAQQGLKERCTILNYHLFYLQQANEYGFDTSEQIYEILNNPHLSEEQKNETLTILFRQNIFINVENKLKYNSIFIDEIQDFEVDWIKIIRDSFLKTNGEMVLFGDQSQDIYHREDENKRNSPIVLGFGRWIELKKSYRFAIDSPLIKFFQNFQRKFLMKESQENLLINENEYGNQSSFNLNQDNIEYFSYPLERSLQNLSLFSGEIWGMIKLKMRTFRYHPNDIVIIANQFNVLKEIETLISQEEQTAIMFESTEEDEKLLIHYLKSVRPEDTLVETRKKLSKIQHSLYRRDLKNIRQRKKNFFYQNSGKIKLASIHSYKGFESKAVFYIALPNDNPELVYTALTRCKEDIYIFDLAHTEHTLFLKMEIEQNRL